MPIVTIGYVLRSTDIQMLVAFRKQIDSACLVERRTAGNGLHTRGDTGFHRPIMPIMPIWLSRLMY